MGEGTWADPALPHPRQVCLKYYEYEFMELACQCPAVVCCRCAPTQKAQIVRLLQERTGKLTCAVGRAPRLRRAAFQSGGWALPLGSSGHDIYPILSLALVLFYCYCF